jgi:hypothetical protein
MNKVDKTIKLATNQELSIGDLVMHVTVPQLGLGVVVEESTRHHNYWVVKWCDQRYNDVGSMGIHRDYITKVI